MTDGRPAIPAALRRAVLEEAGYACAIPTCRFQTTEIAHIEPWAKVREHTFSNLIALCPNCHTRYDQKREIPKASIHSYKANLALLNSRYSSLERRLIEAAADMEPGEEFPIHIGVRILIWNLISDGLVQESDDPMYLITGFDHGIKTTLLYRFTPKGREFVRRWQGAEPLVG